MEESRTEENMVHIQVRRDSSPPICVLLHPTSARQHHPVKAAFAYQRSATTDAELLRCMDGLSSSLLYVSLPCNRRYD